MDMENKNFWISVIAGIIAMLAFAIVTVNIYHFAPVISPFIGGIVTGLVARRDALYGGKAGVVSGVAGGLLVLLDFLLGTKLLETVTTPVAALAGGLLLFVAIPYFAIFAFIGGAIGGQMTQCVFTCKSGDTKK